MLPCGGGGANEGDSADMAVNGGNIGNGGGDGGGGEDDEPNLHT